VLQVTSDALLAWNALRSTPGLGPKRLVRVASLLGERGRSAGWLLEAMPADLVALGVPRHVAEDAAAHLASPPPLPDLPAGIAVLCPDDEAYPRARLSERLPLPVVLWAVGNTSLLKARGIAIAGSRSAPAEVLEPAGELAALVAKAGLNVVSGGAPGVDRAAHSSAARTGTTTVALAEGLAHARARTWATESGEAVLVVSGFEPSSVWTASRAMERNSHIAALADAIVIVAAGLSGGSWAQGQLCLRAGKRLFVVDLPPDVAPGNSALIRQGATAIPPDHLDRVVGDLDEDGVGPAQLDLLA
jgi:DNA processing protein